MTGWRVCEALVVVRSMRDKGIRSAPSCVTFGLSEILVQLHLAQWPRGRYKAEQTCKWGIAYHVCDFSEQQWLTNMLVWRVCRWVWASKAASADIYYAKQVLHFRSSSNHLQLGVLNQELTLENCRKWLSKTKKPTSHYLTRYGAVYWILNGHKYTKPEFTTRGELGHRWWSPAQRVSGRRSILNSSKRYIIGTV